jgi:hypothetical protein
MATLLRSLTAENLEDCGVVLGIATFLDRRLRLAKPTAGADGFARKPF